MEWAFRGPATIARRLGADDLDAHQIAAYDPEAFAALLSAKPAVHRYPGSMAKRVQQLGVRPKGWHEAAGAYGEPNSFRSVADITGPESLVKVRAHKQETKAAAKAAKASGT
jgi:hypothetical protein